MTAISTHEPVHSTNAESHALPTRIAVFVYGLICYLAFFGTLLYAIGFIGNWIVPKSIDSGVPGRVLPSLLINSALLVVFVLQHTIMARPAFKRWWMQFIPKSIERSTYVLAACVALGMVYWLWQPLPQVIWSAPSGIANWIISGISLLGWGIVLLASFMVSHFDLFGLRQVWFRLLDRAYSPVGFRLVGLYKLVRHPLMLGFLIAFWATPHMTLGHLFFAAMVTGYIVMGVWFEERDLVAEHGEKYLAYRRAVRGVLPIPRRNPAAGAPVTAGANGATQ